MSSMLWCEKGAQEQGFFLAVDLAWRLELSLALNCHQNQYHSTNWRPIIVVTAKLERRDGLTKTCHVIE